MATEPHAPAPTLAAPAIENELPTYRAISPLAVCSLVLGVLGGLAFANLVFVAASVLALILGAMALLRIKQQPEALTGKGFAQAGIALGLVTGLSSVTIDFTQHFMMARAAENYTKESIIPYLNARDLNGALWLKTHPDQRRGMTPEQVMDMYKERNAKDPMAFHAAAGAVVALNKILETFPDAQVKFSRIEAADFDGMTPYAIVMLKVEGMGDRKKLEQASLSSKDGSLPSTLRGMAVNPYDPGLEYVGVSIKAVGDPGNQSWWVEDYKYPYKPNTLQQKVKPVDDGHGHSHGEGE